MVFGPDDVFSNATCRIFRNLRQCMALRGLVGSVTLETTAWYCHCIGGRSVFVRRFTDTTIDSPATRPASIRKSSIPLGPEKCVPDRIGKVISAPSGVRIVRPFVPSNTLTL